MTDGSRRVLLSCSVRLEPELASAGMARRLLREALAETDRQEWIDSAELAIGEVVANAVLHAHTAIEVSLEVRTEHVHVEVQDFSAAVPVPRSADTQATTGRGMALVAALSIECGVRHLGPDGKVVWFEVGPEEHTPADEAALLAAWDTWDTLTTAEESTPDVAGSIGVRLLGLPPTLWVAARQHHDGMLRELVLYEAQHGDLGVDLRLVDAARGVVTAALRTQLGALPELDAPLPASDWRGVGGVSPVDFTVRMSADLPPAYAALKQSLDLAEGLAVRGRLLVRPGLPEIVDVRDWVCGEVAAQADGHPPTPWQGMNQRRFETISHDRDAPDLPVWDAAAVREAPTGMVAADDANRIVAVSRSLAELLGWSVDELVGRRVVTIVPPELRERHVAGFSRHLNTGQAHILGVPIEVPVLRRDETRIACRLLIEQAPANAGRSVYLARIDPLD